MIIHCDICKSTDIPSDYLQADRKGEKALKVGKCGHIFHRYCLRRFHKTRVKEQRICPLRCPSAYWLTLPNGIFNEAPDPSSSPPRAAREVRVLRSRRKSLEMVDFDSDEDPRDMAADSEDEDVNAQQNNLETALEQARAEKNRAEQENVALKHAQALATAALAEKQAENSRMLRDIEKARNARNRLQLERDEKARELATALRRLESAEESAQKVSLEAQQSVQEANKECKDMRARLRSAEPLKAKVAKLEETLASYERTHAKWQLHCEKLQKSNKSLEERLAASEKRQRRHADEDMSQQHMQAAESQPKATLVDNDFKNPLNKRRRLSSSPGTESMPKYRDVSVQRATATGKLNEFGQANALSLFVDDDDLNAVETQVLDVDGSDGVEESFQAQDSARFQTFRQPCLTSIQSSASRPTEFRLPPKHKQALGPKRKIKLR